MADFNIEYFEDENGKCPVEEFILSQNNKMRAKIFRALDILAQNGYSLREPYSKQLEKDLYELRIQQGSDITRILYFFVVNGKVILLSGFVKKTQKTPKKEIALAKKRREQYILQEGN